MGLNSDGPLILSNISIDAQLAGDRRVHPRSAPRAIGIIVVGFLSRASGGHLLHIGDGSAAARS